MRRLAIVVLNYLNYKDTIECVDSILEMQYSICGIVIVENGSHNESWRMLKKIYGNVKQVYIIESRKNKGYARGNNLGIAYARKQLKAEYVLVVNNDTVMIDKNYVNGLLNKYEPGVAVIGSRILLQNGNEQYPMLCYLGVRDSVFRYVNRLSEIYGSSFEFLEAEGEPVYILHGCALMLTPDFFRYFHGFYRHTFLYCEEVILYLMCQYKGLRQIYAPEVKIYHKEDQSSLMSFHNDKIILNRYAFQSQKYVLWWAIKYRIHLFFKKKKRT